MDTLPIFVRLQGQPVLVLGEGEAADAKRRLVTEAGGLPVTDEATPARLAFLAMPDSAATAARLRARGLLVNVVDQPAECDFLVPAIVDRSPVLLAIGTGGTSASLAKALKERLEWLLDPALGALARAVRAARSAVSVTHPSVPARRAFWATLMAPGAPLDPLAPTADPAAAIASAINSQAEPLNRTDRITIGPEGADALTLRELRLLAQADLLVHPAATPAEILALSRRDAARAIGTTPPGASGRVVILELPAG